LPWASAVNRRILEAERAGQGTVLASPAFERIAHPGHRGRAEVPGGRLRVLMVISRPAGTEDVG
jgi:hypothetical protein